MSEHFEPPADIADSRDSLSLDAPLALFLASALEQCDDPLVDVEQHREYVREVVHFARASERYMAQLQMRSAFHQRLKRLLSLLGQMMVEESLRAVPSAPPGEIEVTATKVAAQMRALAQHVDRECVRRELPVAIVPIRDTFGIDPIDWRHDADL